ncbi:MAG: hypothetical protein ACI94Y_000521 [Maribacter sp.]|jgi:hypothetical protein
MKRLLILIISIILLTFSCKTIGNAVKTEVKDEVVENELKYNEFGMPILLEYTPMMIDLGKVKRGEKRDLSFDYKNTSNEVVEIEVVTACSCTETDYTVSKMEPGGSGKIILVFDSTSKEKSETIDVDIILKNTDPKTDYPIVDRIQFKYELIQ